jgi:hypothetical protein
MTAPEVEATLTRYLRILWRINVTAHYTGTRPYRYGPWWTVGTLRHAQKTARRRNRHVTDQLEGHH